MRVLRRAARRTSASARRFTGWTADGGYADALTVPEAFVVHAAATRSPTSTPRRCSCAGVIGYRALAPRRGRSRATASRCVGFGASAHLAIQVLRHWGCEVRRRDTRGARHRALATRARRVVGRRQPPSARRSRATARWSSRPAGELVPVALGAVRPGGVVSLAGIHMSTVPSFDYALLWRERSLRSVANMTRRDADDFLALAAEADVRAEVEVFALDDANAALVALADGAVRGAAVLQA